MPTFDTSNARDGQLHINVSPVADSISQPALQFLVQQIEEVVVKSGYANVTVIVNQVPPAEIVANGRFAFKIGAANPTGLKGPVIEIKTLDGLLKGEYTISMKRNGWMAQIPPPGRLLKSVLSAQIRNKPRAAIFPAGNPQSFGDRRDDEGVNRFQRPSYPRYHDGSQEADNPYDANAFNAGRARVPAGLQGSNNPRHFNDLKERRAAQGGARPDGLMAQQSGLQQSDLSAINARASPNYRRPPAVPTLPSKDTFNGSPGPQKTFDPLKSQRLQQSQMQHPLSQPSLSNAGRAHVPGAYPNAGHAPRPVPANNLISQNMAKRALMPGNTSLPRTFGNSSRENTRVAGNGKQPEGDSVPLLGNQRQFSAEQRQRLAGQGPNPQKQRQPLLGQPPQVQGQLPLPRGRQQLATGQKRFPQPQRQPPATYNQAQFGGRRAPVQPPDKLDKKTRREKGGGGGCCGGDGDDDGPDPTAGLGRPVDSKAEKKRAQEDIQRMEKDRKKKQKDRKIMQKEEKENGEATLKDEKARRKKEKEAVKKFKKQKKKSSASREAPYAEISGFYPDKEKKGRRWWFG